MTRTEIPTPGTNELTKRLLARGVKLEDVSTWPEGVWAYDTANFCYSREYRFMPVWESPCGLLIHDHGDHWGDTWVNGEFKCAENDNPLFGCPTPAVPCRHRLKLPAGINCQFHRTERAWTEEDSVERLQRKRRSAERRIWQEHYDKYPKWNGVCTNMKIEDLPDGGMRRRIRYRLYECISMHCESEQCVCRCGAARDLRPANIFYDLYIEKRFNDGLVPWSDKKITKGMRVFKKSIAWTDAELCLKIWRHDPDSIQLPAEMCALNACFQAESRELSRDAFFIRHHGWLDGHENVTLTVEIRNIRIGRNEQRDMLQDLRDVRDGIAVIHRSDTEKAAKALKTEKRKAARVKKLAAMMSKTTESGQDLMNFMLRNEKPEIVEAVREESGRMLAKRREKEEKEAAKCAQISMFEEG